MSTAAKANAVVLNHEILLVERSAMVGSIIVSTARQLGLRPVRLVTNVRSAHNFLANYAFDGLIVSLDEEEDEGMLLIQMLRGGYFKSTADAPVAITAALCDAPLAQRIKVLDVRRILLKPFKIRDLVTTIEMLTEAER